MDELQLIQSKIYEIRGQKVMLDFDLAEMYEVETGVNLIKIDRFAPSSKTCCKCGFVYKGLKLSERSWTCSECGTHHDRDFNAACNIKEFGLKALPSERGKVKLVDCPTVDDRPRVLKSRGRKKQEKRRDNSLRSLCL